MPNAQDQWGPTHGDARELCRIQWQRDTEMVKDQQKIIAAIDQLRAAAGLDLPGIGHMTIDPGLVAASDLAAQLSRAEETLAKTLSACGAPDISAARKALAEAERLDSAIRQADNLLAELAPKGIGALQARLAEARAAAGAAETEPAEEPAMLQDQLQAALEAEATALAQRHEAAARHATLRETRAARQASVQSADQILAAVQVEAGDLVDLAARVQNLTAAQPALVQAETDAAAALARLTENAPDLATAQATVSRLRSVVEGRRRDLARLHSDLAGSTAPSARWPMRVPKRPLRNCAAARPPSPPAPPAMSVR